MPKTISSVHPRKDQDRGVAAASRFRRAEAESPNIEDPSQAVRDVGPTHAAIGRAEEIEIGVDGPTLRAAIAVEEVAGVSGNRLQLRPAAVARNPSGPRAERIAVNADPGRAGVG